MLKDIYFTDEYIRIYEANNEGKLETFNFEGQYGKCVYKYLKREIEGEEYFDIATCYGYGGPIFLYYNKEDLILLVKEYREAFEKYCIENKIVSEFIRFHPLIENHKFMDNHMEVELKSQTVSIEISDREAILKNMKHQCRTAIRKAINSDVVIKKTEDISDFIRLYKKTMEKNNAREYYFFSNEFFFNSIKLLKDDIHIFNAIMDGKVISSSIILSHNEYIHCHFIGNDQEYSIYRPTNLLLYEISLWGNDIGAKYFHLGGGSTRPDDDLFRFKKGFCPTGIKDFYIGKKIHNHEVYQQMVDKHKSQHTSDYFPLYRNNNSRK